MAAGNSNYERGTMGVDGHKKTFGGFMGMTVYGGVKGAWYAGVVATAVPFAIASALIAAVHG